MSLLGKASLVMTPNAVKESKVYSIIPSNGNGDLTFTRGTEATSTLNNVSGLIESVPYNLLKYSEQFDQSYWNKTRCTITANSINSPNGTLTADTLVGNSSGVGENYVFVPQNATIGVPNVLSVYIKPINITTIRLVSFTQAGGSVFSLIGSGSVISNLGICSGGLIEPLPNGWYRISTIITPTSTAINNIGISTSGFGIVGDCFYLWGAQLVQDSVPKDYFYTTDRLNVPRLNYDSIGGCPSLLLEPQRTNLLLNSVWAGGGSLPTSWTATFATGTSTPIASIKNPNVTAYRFVTTTQRQVFQQTFSFVLSSITTISVYVEQVTTAINVNQLLLIDGTGTGNPVYLKNNVAITSSTPIEAGNTYALQYSCTLGGSFSCKVGCGTSSNITGDFVLSMPQVEQGAATPTPIAAYSTSYIPTTTSSVTRNADVFSRNNVYTNGLITNSGGTWFLELNNALPLIRDNSTNSLFLSTAASGFGGDGFLFYNPIGSSTRLQIIKYVSSSATAIYTLQSNIVKLAIKWNGTTADIFTNGNKVVSLSSFTGLNMQYLSTGTSMGIPISIKSTMLFPTPLTDAECIALTQ